MTPCVFLYPFGDLFWSAGSRGIGEGVPGDGKWLWAATTLTLLDVFLLLSFRKKSMGVVWKAMTYTGKTIWNVTKGL